MTLSGTGQGIGLLLWITTISIFWIAFARRKSLPVALLLPGLLAALPLAFVFRGLLGDTSLALPTMAAYAVGWLPLSKGGRYVLCSVIVVSGLLNASALGFIEFDLYGLGYFPDWEILPLAALTAVTYRFAPPLAWAWLLGLALSACGLHPSPNVWDVLLDVPATFIAAWIILRRSHQSPV